MTTNWATFFKNKRITVMGLGLLGRTAGDIEFIAKCGAKAITVTDICSAKVLAPSVRRLKKYKNIRFVLGKHRLEDFEDRNFILKAAGVPLKSVYVRYAKRKGVPVYMSAALFAKFAREKGAKIIGVTGTRGKSTVAHLLFHILETAKKRAHLGGNIRGLSTLAMLPQIRKGDFVVMELDSWQLQGFHSLRINPSISVFTSFMPDHLNYYPSMKRYFEDKAAIFRYQKRRDVLVAGPSVLRWLPRAASKVVRAKATDVPKQWKRTLIGKHNEENIACAIGAALALKVPRVAIRRGVETFKGAEGRLERVRDVGGVSIWNDNNATAPAATIAALRALKGMGDLVLIMGGADKKLPLRELVKITSSLAAEVVLLPGTGTNAFKKLYKKGYIEVCTLKDAVRQAMRVAKKGDQLLFSPAFASFGLFKNEYERNDLFLKIVKILK